MVAARKLSRDLGKLAIRMSVTTKPAAAVTLTHVPQVQQGKGMDLVSRIQWDGEQAPRPALNRRRLRHRAQTPIPVDCPGTYVLPGPTDDDGLLADMEVTVTVNPVAS